MLGMLASFPTRDGVQITSYYMYFIYCQKKLNNYSNISLEK